MSFIVPNECVTGARTVAYGARPGSASVFSQAEQRADLVQDLPHRFFRDVT